MRTILVHLNVETPDDDDRSADEVAAEIDKALKASSSDHTVRGLIVVVALAEEV